MVKTLTEKCCVAFGSLVFMAGGLCCTFGFLNNSMMTSFIGFGFLLIAPIFVYALPKKTTCSDTTTNNNNNNNQQLTPVCNVIHVAIIPVGNDPGVNDKPPDYETVVEIPPSYLEATASKY